MANQEHLDILEQGVETWNQWRKEHHNIQPDLSGATLRDVILTKADLTKAVLSRATIKGADLSFANLSAADLTKADLTEANLIGASLYQANLYAATLTRANLTEATLIGATLTRANLTKADLTKANLSYATLAGADLSHADLIETKLKGAILTECRIYGISAWDVELTKATQNNLVITPEDQATITVDNLKIAQFIYLLLNNQEIRDVIDMITSKVILILGRFTDERKKVLDAIRDELRKQNYLPVLFDFEKPASRDITETISTLAHMARFVIADITPLLFLYFLLFPNTNNRRVNHLASLNSYQPFSQFGTVIPAGLKDAWLDMDGRDRLFGFRLSQAVKGRLRIPVLLFIAVCHRALDTIEQ